METYHYYVFMLCASADVGQITELKTKALEEYTERNQTSKHLFFNNIAVNYWSYIHTIL